jgi:hypothetical protein
VACSPYYAEQLFDERGGSLSDVRVSFSSPLVQVISTFAFRLLRLFVFRPSQFACCSLLHFISSFTFHFNSSIAIRTLLFTSFHYVWHVFHLGHNGFISLSSYPFHLIRSAFYAFPFRTSSHLYALLLFRVATASTGGGVADRVVRSGFAIVRDHGFTICNSFTLQYSLISRI